MYWAVTRPEMNNITKHILLFKKNHTLVNVYHTQRYMNNGIMYTMLLTKEYL